MARGYGQNLYEDEEGRIRPRVAQVIDARAPMADLSKNKPMSSVAPATLTAPSLTPAGTWNEMFRPRQPAPPLPSLTTLAAGGMNSAQRWTAPPTATPPASLNQFSTTPADATAIARQYGNPPKPEATPAYDWKKSFSWASAFNR